MEPDRIRSAVERYYTDKLRAHGPTHQGVDWSSGESQALRFEQLLQVCREAPDFSLNDYGCGYGALADFLRTRGGRFRYRGLDLSAEMVAEAKKMHAGLEGVSFVTDESQMESADYTVASGLFNVKLDTPDHEWSAYVLETLGHMDTLSRQGFAFNALSLYSDPERRRADLHYADPLVLFDHCKRTFSPWVSLIHDYPLYEFTILVRKKPEVGAWPR